MNQNSRDMTDKPSLSFEFFPPKNERMKEQLWEAVGMLSTLDPAFMTVTYGAGGSTRDWTVEAATHIHQDTGIPVAAHLTCVCTPKEEIALIADRLWANKIRHIVALRGDAPKDGEIPRPDDEHYFHYSSDLVEGLLALHPFEISVAAYPEKHPEAPSLDADIEALKKKQDAGATRAITQFFFDNDRFYSFLDKAQAAGITMPIVPGIMPIANFEKSVGFAERCGTYVPDKVKQKFENIKDDPEACRITAGLVLADQVEALMEKGTNSFHFYTLNQARLTYTACRHLGLGQNKSTSVF